MLEGEHSYFNWEASLRLTTLEMNEGVPKYHKTVCSNTDKEYCRVTSYEVSLQLYFVSQLTFKPLSKRSVKSAAAEISRDKKATDSLTCVGQG